MSNSYSSLCDDFYVDMYVNTELDLPNERDRLLTFFEMIQRQYSEMGNFYRRDNGDYCLEGDRDSGEYRWVAVELDRLVAGYVNPPDVQSAKALDMFVLDLAPHMLGISHLDVDSLDVTFAMDFDYEGNHDEVIADALFTGTAFGSLIEDNDRKAIGFSPTVLISLSDDYRLQARLSVESHTSVYEVRSGKYKSDDPISLYLTVRQYPRPDVKFDTAASLKRQFEIAEELMTEKIIPRFVTPLTSAIAHRR